jgi:glutamyl-tRNA synthetase
MIEKFDLPQIGRSPARFDFAKLENINGHYMRASADADLLAALEQALPHIQGGDELATKMTQALRTKLLAAMPGLKERAKTLIDLFEGTRFIWTARPLPIEDKAQALLTPEARQLLTRLVEKLSTNNTWSAASTELDVRAVADAAAVKLGSVAQPLRAALTGRTTSPGIFDVLDVLGKDESLARLRDQAAS